MSTVFFQIGQCGNQLGQAFNDYMLKEVQKNKNKYKNK